MRVDFFNQKMTEFVAAEHTWTLHATKIRDAMSKCNAVGASMEFGDRNASLQTAIEHFERYAQAMLEGSGF